MIAAKGWLGEDAGMELLTPTPSLPFTADALRRWLLAELWSGPRELRDLAESLADERGITEDDAQDLICFGIDDHGGIAYVGPEQDVVMLLEELVEGITFTHRITATEADSGVVGAFPDFIVPLVIRLDSPRPDERPDYPGLLIGPDGVTWAYRESPENTAAFDHVNTTGVSNRTLVGPTGWLGDNVDGFVALTGTSTGWSVSVVKPSTPPAFDSTLATALRASFATVTGDQTGLVLAVVMDAIGSVIETGGNERTDWIEPLSEVVSESGRRVHRQLVGGPDVDWDAYDRRRGQDMFANIWSVSPAVAEAMLLCMDAVNAVRREVPTTDDEKLAILHRLTQPGVVEGLAANVVHTFRRRTVDTPWPGLESDTRDEPDDAHGFTDALAALLADAAEVTKGTARARIDWLASRVALDHDGALALLRSATGHDPRFLPALDDLVWFAAINAFDGSGRARLDLALQEWISAGGVSKALIQNREDATPRQMLRFACSTVTRGTVRNIGPSVGRNDPCPCGSGRKYKQCHNGKPIGAVDGSSVPSAAVRSMIPWVQALQLLWFERTNQRYFEDIIEELDAVAEGDMRNLISTFVADADVSTHMRTEDFLNTTVGDGAVWPTGLAEVLRSWADRPFGLYEVEDRVVGQKLWIRDLRSGERSVIEAPETSRHYGVGAMFLSRLVYNGEAMQMSFGCVPMALRDRERTLAMLDEFNGRPDALSLALFLAGDDPIVGEAGGPAMRNTDGDEIIIHRSLVRAKNIATVDDVAAAFAKRDNLQRVDEELGDRSVTWHVIGGGVGQTIRGAVQVGASPDGMWLIVETNSVRRHDEAMALLRVALGEIDQLDSTVDNTEDRHFAEEFADLGLEPPSMTPLGLRGASADELTPDVMTQIALQLEERWMSEGVPVLGGLTPREAADDPTRRRDLVALLASFPPSAPGAITFDPKRLATALGVDLG